MHFRALFCTARGEAQAAAGCSAATEVDVGGEEAVILRVKRGKGPGVAQQNFAAAMTCHLRSEIRMQRPHSLPPPTSLSLCGAAIFLNVACTLETMSLPQRLVNRNSCFARAARQTARHILQFSWFTIRYILNSFQSRNKSTALRNFAMADVSHTSHSRNFLKRTCLICHEMPPTAYILGDPPTG